MSGYPEFNAGPAWVPVWLPIQFLDRTKNDTYLVRVENSDGSGIGPGWIDKAWFCDDDGIWYDGAFKPLERGPWKITAFAPWPDLADIVVTHSSACATSHTPAYPAGPCDCGADALIAASKSGGSDA